MMKKCVNNCVTNNRKNRSMPTQSSWQQERILFLHWSHIKNDDTLYFVSYKL